MNRPKALTTTHMVESSAEHVEPGLLLIFRTVVCIQLGLVLLHIGMFALASLRVFSFEVEPMSWRTLFGFTWNGFLALYLFAKPWPARLGRWYLPLALLIATICTYVDFYWGLQEVFVLFTEQQPGPDMSAAFRLSVLLSVGGWMLLIGLLTPLVVLASQYPLRFVVGYVILIAGGELACYLLIDGWTANGSELVKPVFVVVTVIHSVIFGLIGYIVNRIMSAQRQHRQALAAANLQLSQYAATLEQLASSRERNRLARELHDTLAHTLSAVAVQLEAVDSAWESNPTKARELLVKSLGQTRSGLTETRRALQALRAAPLEDLGLALAIRTLAESTAKRAGLHLQIALDELEPLSSEVEQQIYRIAQEALMNVLKHSAASTLRVELRQANGLLTLLIEDDGRGFVPDASETALVEQGHYGLRGMRERAELIGAALEFIPVRPQGTRVQLSLSEGAV
jgi:signal transduction histidine kinase